jgi:SAM-dependent methyltransferase
VTIGIPRRESTFHDAWASSTSPEAVLVREAFEAPTALENRFILGLIERHLGGLRGIRLLDMGCGLGESAAYFAMRGAQVTATDLSPEMLRVARTVAGRHGAALRESVASADALPFASASFDAVYIANTLHHLPDPPAVLREIQRVLRPGGWFFSWDPLAYNPVINLYRRMADQVRTADESPLDFSILHAARALFPGARFRCFWVASLALFLKYFLVDRIHPNADRYWKRIYKETEASLWWWKPLRLLDRALTRLPGVRALAWNIVLWGRKESVSA